MLEIDASASIYYCLLKILIKIIAGVTKYIPTFNRIKLIPYPRTVSSESGSTFMKSFNKFYYSFSPGIADLERVSPLFKEAVKLGITPLITSLSILNYVELDSEETVLGYGISLILLNVGMYFVAPVIILIRIFKRQ